MTTPDPRICRTPPPWDHLSLAEVLECEELAAAIVGCHPVAHMRQHRRLADLLKRRVRPQYETVRKRAA